MNRLLVFLFFTTFFSRFLLRERFPHIIDTLVAIREVEGLSMPIDEPITRYFLYIMAGKTFTLLTHNPQTALLLLSAIASSMCAIMIFLIAERMFEKKTAIFASLIFLGAGTFWFFGLIPLPYIVSLTFHLLIIYSLMRIIQGSQRYMLLAALSSALLLGFRMNEIFFVFTPILSLVFFLKRKIIIQSMLFFVLVLLSWSIPLIHLSGGPMRVFASLVSGSAGIQPIGIENTIFYTRTVANSLLAAFPILLLPLFLYPLFISTRIGLFPALNKMFPKPFVLSFLLVWSLPMLLFLIVVKADHPAHTLGFLALVSIILARILTCFSKDIQRWFSALHCPNYFCPVIAFFPILFLIGANALFFFKDQNSPKPPYLSYAKIATRDEHFSMKRSSIRHTYDPALTMIVVQQREWAPLGFAIPEYAVVTFEDVSRTGVHFDRYVSRIQYQKEERSQRSSDRYSPPNTVDRIIFFDHEFAEWLKSDRKKIVPISDGIFLTELSINDGDQLALSYHRIEDLPKE